MINKYEDYIKYLTQFCTMDTIIVIIMVTTFSVFIIFRNNFESILVGKNNNLKDLTFNTQNSFYFVVRRDSTRPRIRQEKSHGHSPYNRHKGRPLTTSRPGSGGPTDLPSPSIQQRCTESKKCRSDLWYEGNNANRSFVLEPLRHFRRNERRPFSKILPFKL